MTRWHVALYGKADKDRAKRIIDAAPYGTRVDVKHERRSTVQNAKLWACLGDIAYQCSHNGRKYTPDQWKVLMLHACGREVQFLPSLDNSTFIPWGQSSSDLSKQEMAELLSFIEAWGAEHGVVFNEPAAAGHGAEAA